MIPSSPDIGIGITTKNRWDDLAITLGHLRDEGLDEVETVVVDDGSDQPMPSGFAEKFSWVKFERSTKSEGNIIQRNRLVHLLSTEFYLSLDDDSCPVAGDLEAAATWLRKHPSVAVLAFRIILADDPVPDDAEPSPPVLVQDFNACGALLRRDLFISLGGYEARLHFYNEEPEYSFRTFQHGYFNYAWPSMVVRHRVTSAARPRASRAIYFVRNIVLLDLWYYPNPQSILRALGHPFRLFLEKPAFRPYWWAMILGWIEGFLCYFAWWRLKRRLTPSQLEDWNKRPTAAGACLDS